MPEDQQLVVFFDGKCNLCNASIDLLVRRDRQAILKFSSLQGRCAARVLPTFGIDPEKLSSILFLERGKLHKESTAVLKITGYMGGVWPLAKVLLVIPRLVRDIFYRIVARNRYRWFGKTSTCRLPTAEEAARFLD